MTSLDGLTSKYEVTKQGETYKPVVNTTDVVTSSYVTANVTTTESYFSTSDEKMNSTELTASATNGSEPLRFLTEKSENGTEFLSPENMVPTSVLEDGSFMFEFENITLTLSGEFAKRSWMSSTDSTLVWTLGNLVYSDSGTYALEYDSPINITECHLGYNVSVIAGNKTNLLSWESWTSWTGCQPPCRHDIRSRNRKCPETGQCGEGEIIQTELCHPDGLCPAWSEWSPCSVSCGAGTRYRKRQCNSNTTENTTTHSNSNSSINSVFEKLWGCDTNITVICSLPACSEGWDEWTLWGHCSVTCGGGFKTRQRLCSLPDTECRGEKLEKMDCNENMCEDSASHDDVSAPVDLSIIIATAVSVFMMALLVLIIVLLRRLKWKKTTVYAISHEVPKNKKLRTLSDTDRMETENLYTEMALSCEPTSPTHIYLPSEYDDSGVISFPSEVRSQTTSFKLKQNKSCSDKTKESSQIAESPEVVEHDECSETESSGMPTTADDNNPEEPGTNNDVISSE